MWFLLSILVLIGLGILTALFLILKKLSVFSFPQAIEKKDSNIESSVHNGLKSAIKELEYEKEEHELLMKGLDQGQKGAMGVFNTSNQEEPIDTQGYLIPANLNETEKELLRMFYNNQ